MTGGRENVGTDVDGEKIEMSSSVASGSGGSIGRYLLSTEAMAFGMSLLVVMMVMEGVPKRRASCYLYKNKR